MSLKDREIDENGYVVIEPLIQMNVDKKMDEKKYNRIYHREYYKRFLSVKVQCEFCGCSIVKEKMKVHHKSTKCHRLRETYNIGGVANDNQIVAEP